MRFATILMTTFFLISGNTFAGGLTSGNLNGNRDDAKDPLVEEIRKAKFGDKKSVGSGKHKRKKTKRD